MMLSTPSAQISVPATVTTWWRMSAPRPTPNDGHEPGRDQHEGDRLAAVSPVVIEPRSRSRPRTSVADQRDQDEDHPTTASTTTPTTTQTASLTAITCRAAA